MKGNRDINTRWGQLVIYGVLLVLVVCTMLWIKFKFQGGHNHDYADSLKGDTIHAAIVYGPNSYRVLISENGNDSIVGVNYQMLNDLEKKLGVKVDLVPVIDRDEALSKIKAGSYDILASLPADNYIKQNFLTTKEVFLDRMVLIQKRNENGTLSVSSALDLEGDTVHVEKESAAIRRLENLKKEIGGKINIVEEPGLSEEYIAMKVGTGVWKYAVINEKIAEEMKKLYPMLDYSTPISFTQFQVWVLPFGKDSLLNTINRFLIENLE
ncbi:MAG: transporter substrate-binding domain-containing protein [Muribaculaceae bacterium]|nr:transporter substrate-binding domain-containing protein [Muribaculaceae bacterium]